MKRYITLSEGNGGEENRELIEKVFFRHLGNDLLKRAEDATPIECKPNMVTSIDSFTISPIFFEGGDIGKLSICGTCNDIAMMGAKPKYITLSVVIEEGFDVRSLEKIVRSIKKELSVNGAIVVSGDTKVVPKGSVDKIFITTTGIGEVLYSGISISNIKVGDAVIVSRDIGSHGASIFASREGIEIQNDLKSDCASLWLQVEALINSGITLHALRDATRGGVSAVLNEWAVANNCSIEIEEASIPISQSVAGICEMLGFEATSLANEGTFLIALPKSEANKAIEILKEFDNSSNAAVIGEVTDDYKGKVVLKSQWGTKRFLDLPTGELLPRIC